MKVVLFCGGMGTRLWGFNQDVPKPMVHIGYRPLLWYVMRYYAYHGHRDFILCLGYKADVIKQYFLDYHEAISNDFVMTGSSGDIELLNSDIDDWRITFVDTGRRALIGERLRRVRHLLDGEGTFLANYSDGLTDAPLEKIIRQHEELDSTVTLMTAQPSGSFHIVDHDGPRITGFSHISDTGRKVNAGFYVMNEDVFDYIEEGEDLVAQPFDRLITAGGLYGYHYDGFFKPLDTFKDKQVLESLKSDGSPPWEVWREDVNGEERQV